MPQITVEYSAALDDVFARRDFALALHPAAAAIIDSDLDNFKTRFYRVDEAVIGDGADTKAMVHLDLAILPGRDDDTKRQLGTTALDLVCRNLTAPAGLMVQVTVEVRDQDGPNYHKRVLTGS
jgi:5-carboxymethyl-2-hydroxymuconate isomerase